MFASYGLIKMIIITFLLDWTKQDYPLGGPQRQKLAMGP